MTLLAHKIELRPTPEQADYLSRACGSRRHCYNQLLAHFGQESVKWSKAAAYQHYIKTVRPAFPWYNEVSARVTRNAIDDLDAAFRHFFRRVKEGKRQGSSFGFPTFKRKGVNDSFALREKPKFDLDGRTLRIGKLKTRIRMRQRVRWSGTPCQVTISMRAGKFYASVLVETEDYNPHAPSEASVGVDFGVKALATLSNGTPIPANQKLKANLRRLQRRSRRLSRKVKGSNRRAKAKLSLSKLHKRIADQREAVLHELSDKLTRTYKVVCIEDLNVRGMVRNRSLARAIADAGFGTLRQMIEYKAALRGVEVVVIGRFVPTTRPCSGCGTLHDMPLGKERLVCACGVDMDRDLNAAINIERIGLDTLAPDLKRTQERRQTVGSPVAAALTA